MSGWLIDSAGEITFEGSPNLMSSLYARLSPEEFARYALVNMGWARLKEGQHGLQVSWRPTTLTEVTFAGLLLALRRRGPARVLVETLHNGWSYKIFATVESATQHLAHVFDTAVCDGEEGYFAARRRRVESLESGSSLGELLRSVPPCASAAALHDILQAHAQRPFMLVHAAGEHAPLRLMLWGEGFQRYPSTRLRAMANFSIEEQPDKTYARRISAAYRQVMATGSPIVEDITTSTWWPGRGRTSFRYTRLLAPIRIAGLGTCVLCCSQGVARLEPGFELRHEL
ncbi:MAG: hypothetical protein AB7L90_02260 [Hyphomicrobiaceae bacterium]